MAAEPSVDGCGEGEGRAARRPAADRAALFRRAADDCGGFVRFEEPVFRAVRLDGFDPFDDFAADLRGFAVFRAAPRPAPAAFFRLPARTGAAFRAPLRVTAVFAPFFFPVPAFFAVPDLPFAERFFAAFAMS